MAPRSRTSVLLIALWIVCVTIGAGPHAGTWLRLYVQIVANFCGYGALAVVVAIAVAAGIVEPAVPQAPWMIEVIHAGVSVGEAIAVTLPAWVVVWGTRWWARRHTREPVEFTGLFRATWQAMLAHVPRYLGLAFLTFVGMRAAAGTVDAFVVEPRLAAYGLAACAWTIHVLLGAVLLRLCLAIVDGRSLSMREAIPGPTTLLRFGVLCELWTAGTLLGVTALLLPGVVWAICSSFAGLLLVEQRVGFFAALRRSVRMTSGLRWRLFKLGALWLPTSVLFGVMRHLSATHAAPHLALEIVHALILPAITLLLCMAYRRVGAIRSIDVVAERPVWRWAPDTALALGWTCAAALPVAILLARHLVAWCAGMNAS